MAAPILSTNRGYVYKQIETNPYVHKLFKVKHEVEEIGQELLAIVDNGGRVQNTLIDHPVYGEIETLLKTVLPQRCSTFSRTSRAF